MSTLTLSPTCPELRLQAPSELDEQRSLNDGTGKAGEDRAASEVERPAQANRTLETVGEPAVPRVCGDTRAKHPFHRGVD